MARSQRYSPSRFETIILQPAEAVSGSPFAFVVLPKTASAKLPRRGRTSVQGTINGQEFTALLEPDGNKSHWLPLDRKLLRAAGVGIGDAVEFEVQPVKQEPEPEVPADLQQALDESPEARVTWYGTTTIARLDWIHWITTARQAATRTKRIEDACDMLARGKKRVCCFDPSGFYSKAFCAPEPASQPPGPGIVSKPRVTHE